jgi:hypothetical protein
MKVIKAYDSDENPNQEIDLQLLNEEISDTIIITAGFKYKIQILWYDGKMELPGSISFLVEKWN